MFPKKEYKSIINDIVFLRVDIVLYKTVSENLQAVIYLFLQFAYIVKYHT